MSKRTVTDEGEVHDVVRFLRRPAVRRISRDTVLFVGGLAGITYETLRNSAERPTLLLLFAAMVGLPAFLRGDEREQDAAGGDA
jgi:hypothetical protein